MSTLYLTVSFQKQLGRQIYLLAQVIEQIRRYDRGGNNLLDLYSPGNDLKVLKGYLSGKGIRVTVLLRVSKRIYIPFLLVKKESKQGWNLSKYSEEFLLSKIERVWQDVQRLKYEIIEL